MLPVVYSNRIYLLNLKTNVWSVVQPKNHPESPQIPELSFAHALAPDFERNCFYVFGGKSSYLQFYFGLHKFDFTTLMWHRITNAVPDDIGGRYRHQMALWDEKLFIFGGYFPFYKPGIEHVINQVSCVVANSHWLRGT